MNGLPYYKAYPRDFIEGTIGMPFELKGAYRLVLDLIYMQGGNLPDNARYISGLLGCTLRKWTALRSELVKRDKIQVISGYLSNYRAVIELETLAKLQDNNRENRSRPNKIKDLQSPSFDQRAIYTEPELEEEERKESEPVGSPKKTILNLVVDVPRKARACRLPDEWVPSDRNVSDARTKNFSDEEIQNEADQFRNHHLARGTTFINWDAGWRTWITNARKFAANRGMAGQSFPGRSGQGSSIASIVARRRTERAV